MLHMYKFSILLATVALIVALIASLSAPRALYQSFISDGATAQSQQQQIDTQFDSISGAHIKLEKLIKQYIPNPDSYQHASSRYKQIQDQITVYTEYTSINSLGERSKAEAIVVYHVNGLMINLLKVD